MSDDLFIFKPTVLMVKQHNKTGKLYFCKTTRLDLIESYCGSGEYWNRHLKKHGKDWSNIWVSDVFYDKEDLVEFALFFSEFFNIVKSSDWANKKPENGLDGGFASGYSNFLVDGEVKYMLVKEANKKGFVSYNKGENHVFFGKTRKEHSDRMSGSKNPAASFSEMVLWNVETKERMIITKEDYYSKNTPFTRKQLERLKSGLFANKVWSIHLPEKALEIKEEQRLRLVEKNREMSNRRWQNIKTA